MKRKFWKLNTRPAKMAFLGLLTATICGCGGNLEEFVVTTPQGVVTLIPTGVQLTPDAATITVGGTQTYVLNVTFANANPAAAPGATYSSDNPAVVTIDPNTGVATAISVGTTTLRGSVTVNGTTFSDDTTVTVTAVVPNNNLIDVFVSNNGGTPGNLDLFDRLFTAVRTFASGSNQGIAIDSLGTVYQNEDSPDPQVSIISNAARRGSTGFNLGGAAFDSNFDRVFDLTRVLDPAVKGSDIAERQGMLIMANFATNAASAGLVVVGTVSNTDFNLFKLPTTPARPWDVAYDDPNDRLYVAFTNGTIGVYDHWFVGIVLGDPAPTRTISPTGLVNAHGIAFDSDSNTLIVSDVGAVTSGAGAGDDGAIYVIPNASTASGAATAKIIKGSATKLGNPVDIDLRNGDLRVAEKANQRLLTFSDIVNTPGGDIAPTTDVAYNAAESVRSAPHERNLKPDVTDVTATNATVTNLLVSTSDAATPDGKLFRVSPDLSTGSNIFTPGGIFAFNGMESICLDNQGDAYATADTGLYAIGRLGNGVRDGDALRSTRDRPLASTAGKGLDVADEAGIVVMADNTTTVRVFSKNVGSGAPFYTVTGSGNAWDVDYDPAGDKLYVAINGNAVDIYDDFLANRPATPTRTLTITGATRLHGIVHDAANSRLIVSDLGATVGNGTGDDGAIHIINITNSSNGAVAPTTTISGGATNIADPVDIVFDGTFVYTAEKFEDAVRRYNLSGATPTAPEATSFTVDSPESITLGFAVLNT